MALFQKATRKKAKLRLALTGVTGAGKTLSALYIAYGITGDWSKVALIDTEHERGRFYACRDDLDTGEFLYLSFEPPYTAEKYKEYVIAGAKEVGEDGVVIIDSFTHAWNNEGGILERKDKMVNPSKGVTSYTAWNEAGKLQNNLVNTILAVDCHTIVTMRSKMDYVMVENEKGKQAPKKVGLQPIQREDTEYEFDIAFDIDRTHIATTTKDTTFLDNWSDVLTVELGEKLQEWLSQGVDDKETKKISDIQRKQIFVKIADKNESLMKAAMAEFGYMGSTADILAKDYDLIVGKILELKEKETVQDE